MNQVQKPKVFLFKKSTSQENILQAISSNTSCDTPETFLNPLPINQLNLQTIKVEDGTYKCLPAATSRFNGLEADETGKLMSRRLIGDQELYYQGESSNRRKISLPRAT